MPAVPETRTLLSVRQLSCERNGWPLFEPVDVELGHGDIVHVTGPNGSGKTTLLRTLAGLAQAAGGSLAWRDAAFLYLGHRSGIKQLLSPHENLRWYLAARASLPTAEADAAIAAALAHWDLDGYGDRSCQQLSAGQQQRVALARLHLHPPPVWLLDEPFTALDRAGVAQLERELLRHAARGGAVILTSHHAFPHEAGVRELALGPAREAA